MALTFDSIGRAKQAALACPGLPARVAVQLVEFFGVLSAQGNPDLDVIILDAPANTFGIDAVPAETFRLFGYITFAVGETTKGADVASELLDNAPGTLVQAYGNINSEGEFEFVQLINTGNLYLAANGPFTLDNPSAETDLRVVLIVSRG